MNGPEDVVSQQNVHPFLYSGAHVALAHNGYLRDFGRMRHGLLEFIRPELARTGAGLIPCHRQTFMETLRAGTTKLPSA
jgi:predicted glutamine amidotransferase